MPRRKRPISVRKAKARSIAVNERTYAKAPHNFIFARPGVGSLVKQLSFDLRRVFEPFTATRLQVSRQNVLKDFINIAGPMNVTHLMYFTHPRLEKVSAKRSRHSTNLARRRSLKSHPDSVESPAGAVDETLEASQRGGGVFFHLIRVPRGPSLTFGVLEYSLQREVLSLVQRVFDTRQYTTSPLLAMSGFGNPSVTKAAPPPHVRLMVDMFQNMMPSLNVQKVKLSAIKRVVLLSREVDVCSGEDIVYFRHYHIRTENRTISKALRRLGMGGSITRKNVQAGGVGPCGSGRSSGVPSLAKYATIEDYLTKTGLLTDSGLSDGDMREVDLPTAYGSASPAATASEYSQLRPRDRRKKVLAEARAAHGMTHLSTARKAAIRLFEIGPRLTLRLIKIEEGLNAGSVLYHRWQSRLPAEVHRAQEQRRRVQAEKAARRHLQEKHRLANEAAKQAHRTVCLQGMQSASPDDSTAKPKLPRSSKKRRLS